MTSLPQAATELWTILDSTGRGIVAFGSFIEAEIKDAYKVTQYPLEEGGLAAYDKTASPLDVYVTLAKSGDDAEIGEALDTLMALAAGTELVSLVTPEKEYENLNIDNVNFTRKREDGLGVVYFELHLVEIRQVKPRYTKAISLAGAKDKESATSVDTGKKQVSVLSGLSEALTGSGRIY